MVRQSLIPVSIQGAMAPAGGLDIACAGDCKEGLYQAQKIKQALLWEAALLTQDRDPGCGWNTVLWLPRHDLGQAAWALRSRVSSSLKLRYDIQVGWEPCREVLSLVQRIIIPGPGPKHTAIWRAIPSKDPGSGTQPKNRPDVFFELQAHCYTFTFVSGSR